MAERLNWIHGAQLLLLMSREIITAPFAVAYSISGKALPHATYIAKVTTFIQEFALPALILSIYYPAWAFISIPLSVVCLITGSISAGHYIKSTSPVKNFNKKKK